jgi:Skp family chaperone for outer membrane proteins
MSNEFKDKMLQLLTQVDDVKATEAALETERKLHQDQIAKSEADLKRTENDIEQCRETRWRYEGKWMI